MRKSFLRGWFIRCILGTGFLGGRLEFWRGRYRAPRKSADRTHKLELSH